MRCKLRGPGSSVRGGLVSATILLSFVVASAWSEETASAQRETRRDATESEYSALIESAVLEFEQEHYPEARALFERAHALQPNARTLRGIGKAAFEMRDYPAAWAALRASIASTARPLTPSMRTEAEELIGRCEAFVGRAVLRGEPEGALVTVDGGEAVRDETGALLLAPGPHRFEIRVGGEPRVSQPIESVAGRTLIVEVNQTAGSNPQGPAQDADQLGPPGSRRIFRIVLAGIARSGSSSARERRPRWRSVVASTGPTEPTRSPIAGMRSTR